MHYTFCAFTVMAIVELPDKCMSLELHLGAKIPGGNPSNNNLFYNF